MNLLTLAVLCICISSCTCLELPVKLSIGDNAIVLLVLATFGTISLIGACAFCFRKKKTFEKLENEAGSPENLKKNEYPIFRALATDVTESSAIVPCERNNLSRDNLLNSSDNLTTPDHHHHLHDGSNGSLRKLDAVDSSDVVVLLDKSMTQRDKASRDTITFETEKKHQYSPSSKTPLLYAKNVQSYQEQPPINEQIQQKSVASNLLSHCEKASSSTSLDGFYNIRGCDAEKLDEVDDFMMTNKSLSTSENNNGTAPLGTSSVNPFFNSTSEEFESVKEMLKDKDDTSEIESSINDNSEKYQILEEETDGEDIKIDDSPAIKAPHRKNSDYSASEDKSVEEALKALDMAIGFEDYDDDEIFEEKPDKLDEIKEEANFLVDSIVNDCEKIMEDKQKEEFDDFLALSDQNISTPCAANKTTKLFSNDANIDIAKVLFPGGVDLSEGINDATFPINQTYEVNDKTFEVAQPPPTIKIEKDNDEASSEDLTTVTPVNTPIELSYSSETWDKMSYSNTSKGAISKIPQKQIQPETPKEEPTFNQDGWYLHPNSSMKNDTFDIYCDDEETDEGNMEDMNSTFDQLRRQLTEMLPHAQGMSVHNDFLDDDDDLSRNKDSISPSDNNYGIKYGELDEASNAGSFDLLGAILNPEPVTELNINYHSAKRPLSPILEESECEETCRTFVFNNETKLLDSTSTGILESASMSDAVIGQMGQVPKALMASNDTLFNFEDTLSDHTDNLLMSPRMNTAGSSTSSTLSRQESHDRISNERTPTNEDLPKIGEFNAIDIVKNNIRQHPLSLDLNPVVVEASTKYELARAVLEEGSWPLELPEAQQIVNDLSSPDQNPTADSLSFEQDITYTIDDQKTCVSLVLKNDEERISEISEPMFASDGFDVFADDANSLQIDDAISLEIDDNCNLEINDENGNQNGTTKDIELVLNETASSNYDNDSINPGGDNLSKFEYEIDSLEPEAKILNEDIEIDSIPTSHATKSVYSADSINDDVQNPDTVQSNDTSESTSIASPQKRQLDSSEESNLSNDAENKEKVPSSISLTSSCGKLTTLQDYLQNEVFYATDNGYGSSSKDFYCNYHDFENDPWGGSPDIRQMPCNNAMMSTSFTKEWSDDDSSHSSEEFMYVKGTIEVDKITSPSDKEKSVENKKEEVTESGEQKNSENMDIESASEAKDVEVHSEDDESAEESEFVPSCWDQSLQPSKSSLKSPEREGSIEQQPVKNRRRVAFKIQRYHSVYEYPSEGVVQLSPAYSEPQLWSNYDYSGNIDFFTYANPLADLADNFDGFSVSSSSRPFHNTHNIQIHNTWPNETTDFSWSQYQDPDADGIKFDDPQTSKIEWPSREDDSGCMCESSDSPSIAMGELNHQKNSLRLPLELISSTCSEVSDFMSTTDVLTKDLDAIKIEIPTNESPKPNTIINVEDDDALVDEEFDDKINESILPTPLSGSIDSLSSSSHSASTNSSPPSFTTFGKEAIVKENEVSGKTQTIIFIEEDVTKLTRIDSQKKGKNEAIEKGGVLLQSSDDDSGFENVMQIKCEE